MKVVSSQFDEDNENWIVRLEEQEGDEPGTLGSVLVFRAPSEKDWPVGLELSVTHEITLPRP